MIPGINNSETRSRKALSSTPLSSADNVCLTLDYSVMLETKFDNYIVLLYIDLEKIMTNTTSHRTQCIIFQKE